MNESHQYYPNVELAATPENLTAKPIPVINDFLSPTTFFVWLELGRCWQNLLYIFSVCSFVLVVENSLDRGNWIKLEDNLYNYYNCRINIKLFSVGD